MSIFKKSAPLALPADPGPRTVASITAGLSDTVAELEAHAEDQEAMAAYQKAAAEQAVFAAAEHKAESKLATKVAENIKALLEV